MKQMKRIYKWQNYIIMQKLHNHHKVKLNTLILIIIIKDRIIYNKIIILSTLTYNNNNNGKE